MMAVMSPVPVINLPVNPTGYSFEGRSTPEVMMSLSSRREIVEEEEEEEDENKIYVFLGINPKENLLNLQWIIDNLRGNIIDVMHVHVKSQLIPVEGTGARLPHSSVSDLKAKSHWETEQQKMEQTLKDYVSVCRKSKVQTEKHFHEANCIEKGILELISKHKIKKLVMGAAANKHYSKDMKELRSRKAIYVRDNAPAGCNIWFVCKGNLVQIREGSETAENEAEFPSRPSTRRNGSGRKSTSPRGLFDKIWTVRHKSEKQKVLNSPSGSSGDPPSLLSPKTRSINERLSDWFKRKSPSSRDPDCSSEIVADLHPVVFAITEEGRNRSMRRSPSRNSDSSYSTVVHTFSVITATTEEGHSGLLASASPEYKEDPCQPSPSSTHVSTATKFKDLCGASPSSVLVRNLYDAVEHQLRQPGVAVANTRHNEPLKGAVIQKKADMMGAIHMANAFQRLHNGELHRRKEVEEALAKEKDECETVRKQLDRALEELKNLNDYNLSLEKQNAEYAQMLKEFEQNVKKVVEVLTGEWSRRQADLLTDLALKCREINQRTQPNLKSEAQNEQLKASYAASSSSSSSQPDSEVQTQLPHLFMCPISLQIMQDPHIASDGYTYDRSNIQKWLNAGHDSSPWTNRKLPNSRLTPNRSLRSAIQDWQQQNN